MKAECETCEVRKYYAMAFDFHFTECDCPFECEDENWYTELDDPKIAERSESDE